MKQFYFKSLFLSLLMIVVGNVGVLAQTPDLTLDFTSAWTSNGTKSYKTTIDGKEYVFSGDGTNFKFNNGYFYFGKSGAYIDLPKVDFDVEKIEVVGNSGASAATIMNLFVGDVAVSSETTGCTGTNTYVIDESSQAANTQYRLKVTSNHNAQVTYIKYYKKVQSTATLESITLSGTYPTIFNVGDPFSHEGMTVTANYGDNSTLVVTNKVTFSGYDMDTAGSQTVTVSYTEGEITKTATYGITVNTVSVTGVSLDKTEANLLVGRTLTLTPIIAPENATNKSCTWSSDHPEYATVSDGVVTAVAEGTAIITVTTVDGSFTATCTVNVVDQIAETTATGNLNNTDTGVFAGETGFTSGTHSASGTLATEVGNVTVDYAGTGSSYLNEDHIRMYQSGSTLKFTAPEGYELTKIVFTITSGNSANLGADKGSYSEGTWTGTESDVTFTGKNATIRISAVEVTLKKATEKAKLESIAVDNPKTEFSIGDDFEFGGTVTATYANGTTKNVTAQAEFTGYNLSTSGEQTVTVSYSEGEVTKTVTYDITVSAVAVTGITLDQETLQLKVGKTKKLTATVEPGNATDKTVAWSSDDETVATVDEEGLVTAVAEGNATITAATPDGAITATCAVTVVAPSVADGYYEKVTSAPEDWSGEYLIVYEDGSNAFDGSLETLDAVSNYIEVEIDDNKIPAYEEVSAAAFTIAKTESAYSIKSASGYYIGLSTEGNGLKSSTTTIYDNSIFINSDGTVNVVSQNCYLRFNTAANQTRYRYMKSNDNNNKLPLVCLYKKVGTEAPTTYTLVTIDGNGAGTETETQFDEDLTLTKELPANTEFYIKDSNGKEYYAEHGKNIISAENHENLNTYYPVEDDTPADNPEKFYFMKANTWNFTLTEPTEEGATIKLTITPQTEGETKYMLSGYLQESDDVFDENLKLTKEMTTDEFYFTRSDDYGLTNLTPATFNAPEDRRYWIFSEDAPTVEFIVGEIRGSYTVGEAGTYTFTLNLENKTITTEAVPTTYTLVVGETEYPFDGLTLTQELPAQTKFYVKDNKGNVYHSADAQSEVIIIAENHEDLPTTAEGKDFYLSKANTWVFTLTEASDGLMLTVSPKTAGETKYMLSAYLQESDDVFDDNLKLTKEMTSTTQEFYFTRSDDYGLTNLTPATFNAPEDRRYWIFSEDDPTVEYIAGKILGSYTVGEAGTYTFTLDLENKTVTAEKYVETVDVPVTSAEWATFVAPKPVIFPDDVTAYVISSIEGNVAIGTQVTEVPAGTAVIVNGTEGTHKAVVVEEGVLPAENMLQASDGTVTGDGTIWVLAVQDGEAGFARLGTGKKLSEGKAYLQVEAAGAKLQFVVDGEGTGIHGVNVDFSDGDWYNLQGVKVSTPQKGIYIHNGKKVVIK